jgi:hypothetical protein
LLTESGQNISLTTWSGGKYEIKLADGKVLSAAVNGPPSPLPLDGEWSLSFPPKLGAPATATFDHLMSWTESTDEGVKYFSGSATYEKEVEIPAAYVGAGRRLYLDLGTVKNLAEVTLNGKSLGILWKEPFRVDITKAATAGMNKFQIRADQPLAQPDDWRPKVAGRPAHHVGQRAALQGEFSAAAVRPAGPGPYFTGGNLGFKWGPGFVASAWSGDTTGPTEKREIA